MRSPSPSHLPLHSDSRLPPPPPPLLVCPPLLVSAGTCYEFRVRTASAHGWSAFTAPIMVLTNALPDCVHDNGRAKNTHEPRREGEAAAAAEDAGTGKDSRRANPPAKDVLRQGFRSEDAWSCGVSVLADSDLLVFSLRAQDGHGEGGRGRRDSPSACSRGAGAGVATKPLAPNLWRAA